MRPSAVISVMRAGVSELVVTSANRSLVGDQTPRLRPLRSAVSMVAGAGASRAVSRRWRRLMSRSC